MILIVLMIVGGARLAAGSVLVCVMVVDVTVIVTVIIEVIMMSEERKAPDIA